MADPTLLLGVTALLVGVAQALLLVPAAHGDQHTPFSAERTFIAFKSARLATYGILATSQAALLITHIVLHGLEANVAFAAQVVVALAYLTAFVLLCCKWRNQMTMRLALVMLATVLEALSLLALDVAQAHRKTEHGAPGDKAALDEEYLVRFAVHGVQLLIAAALLIGEVMIQQYTLLPHSAAEGDYEPLLDDVERSSKRGWQPGDGRMAMALNAFRYVWPNTTKLRVRLLACFVLVALERCVNLAVPIFYKHMVEQLGGFGAGPSDSNGFAPAARALLARCAAAVQAVDGQLSAAAAAALLRDSVAAFWAAFYPWTLLYLVLFWLRGGSGAEGLLANIRDLLWIPITQAAFRRVATDVFSHLLCLDLNFHVHRKTGMIMRILDRGTSSIQDTVEVVLFNVLPQMVDIFIACAYLATMMQPWVAGIVLVTVASYVPLTVVITERRMVVRKRMNALDNERESRATDMLLNYETVKYFTNEQFELAGYDTATRQYQSAEYWQMAFLAVLSIVQSTVVWLGLVAGMTLCVLGVARGELTVGDTVLFITMMQQLYLPLTYFSSYYRQVQKALVDMENMFELLATKPLVLDVPNAKPLVVREGKVEFKDVVFAYPPTKKERDKAAAGGGIPRPLPAVLHGVSFGVEGGQTMAIVGSTGSGKSTILRLLLRFYDPTSGAVLIDGQDIRYCTQESVRSAIAVVPQDTVLFNDSVMYNIRYGRTNATDMQVYEASKVAHIHDHLSSFPKGYNTKVGERGLRLSGGEKQRVAFARAVLKNPAILVLDEATSALDSLTERMIQSSLAQMRSRCTGVIVAHRLSTVMDADVIVVLARGKVAEMGSHGELLEQGGLYSEMWARQLSDGGSIGGAPPGGGHVSFGGTSVAGNGDHRSDHRSVRSESPVPPSRAVRKADSTNDLKAARAYLRLHTMDSEVPTPALSPDHSANFEDQHSQGGAGAATPSISEPPDAAEAAARPQQPANRHAGGIVVEDITDMPEDVSGAPGGGQVENGGPGDGQNGGPGASPTGHG